MTVLGRLFGVEERSEISIPQWESNGKWSAGMVWTGTPGVTVTADSAMRLSAVFACLRLLSEAIATLPLDTFTRNQGTREPFRPRPDYLSFQPPEGSRIDYLSQVMLSLLTDGNAFVVTPRDAYGVPLDLIVLDPTLVAIDKVNGRLRYRVRGQPVDMPNDMMHIKGMTLPGQLRGLSPIAYARETIGLGLAAQRFGQNFFENGALPGAVIESPGRMSQQAIERFRDTWNAGHQGVANANRIGVLTEGATLAKVSVAPNDAQFLETRAFQVPDVARIFGVPPHLIADASNSTSWGSGLQEQNLAFGQFSLRPWIERIEDGHNRLLMTHGLVDVFVKLNLDALLRASLRDRYEAAAIGIQNKFLLPNEQRSFEDLAPLPEGADVDMPAPPTLAEQVEAVGALVRAGFDPEAATAAVGLPPVKHLGLLPITLQSESVFKADAAAAADQSDSVRSVEQELLERRHEELGAWMNRPQLPPVNNIAVHLPAPPVNNVTIEAEVPELPVTVNLPEPRAMTRIVHRDAAGNITHTTEEPC